MILTDLHLHNVRNISELKLSLHPQFTILVGNNGVGKTSILEALYLLSRGHSFKTREITPLITHGQKQLTVFARSTDNETLSIQKTIASPTIVKLNNQVCSTASQLAYALPCQVFYQDVFEIMDAGASIRRSILDWGLFHVKQSYLKLWRDYKRVLQQRHVLLKKRASPSLIEPWDLQLVTLAQALDDERKVYFQAWDKAFRTILPQFTDVQCSIEYYKGWDKRNSGKSLELILKEHFDSDMQKQFTQYGAHQADILIHTDEYSAKKTLSRGQQKIILIALKLAQADLLNHPCLYLLDDYASELDRNHQEKLLAALLRRSGQYVLTSTHLDDFGILGADNYQLIPL